ncbi:MAG: biotin--[acetyl-CoA-carboxylase] ligase [Oscillospiraceae bacterium]|nr:biotin--[acetyl-CoA-carboxylase] ligase [Oscillospiraceae bacterium]
MGANTKNLVLQFLEEKRGESVSGGVISRTLGISRNAVWKAVKQLQKAGYKIEGVSNRGYSLCENSDVLSAAGIVSHLRELFGKEMSHKLEVHSVIESTGKAAKEKAIDGAEHGTVILADKITKAKGRYNRKFFTLAGHGVYMSIILRPSQWEEFDSFDVPTLVTAHAAVSVCRAIESTTGKSPQIKWVNDVFLDGKKICGILTEAVTDFESGNMQWIIVGIGINFITPEDGFPDEIKNTAGAVFDRIEGTEPTCSRNRLAAEVINHVLEPDDDSQTLLQEYRRRLMMLGKRVVVSGLKKPFEAVAVDIDETGRLTVRKDDGETLSLSSGEVSLLIS